MTKIINKLSLIAAAFVLSSCSFFVLGESSTSENDSSTTTSESETSSSSEKQVVSKQVVDLSLGTYALGDIYKEKCNIVSRTTYSDGSVSEKPMSYSITAVRNLDTNTNTNLSSPFTVPGSYKTTIAYRDDGSNKTTSFFYEIKTGILEESFTLTSIDFIDVSYVVGQTILETNPELYFDLYWHNSYTNSEVNEVASYSKLSDHMELALYVNGGSANVINSPIVLDSQYKLVASFTKYPTLVASYEFEIAKTSGYYVIEDSPIVYEDFNIVSNPEGVANMFVVTIDIEPGKGNLTALDWTDSQLTNLNNMFFKDTTTGAGGYYSLKTYFEEVSKGKLEISGKIFEPYHATYTMSEINADSSYSKLHQTFNEAVEHIKNSNPSTNWAEYDLNKDGYIDNLHFVTNVSGTNLEWSSPLWPHKYDINNYPGTNSDPLPKVYETTVLGMLSDATTIIHEQSHMFGITDYYNYTQTENEVDINYVGSLEMQSHNAGDWNPWSKFTVGWGNPIVVDGSLDMTKVTFQSSALTNQFVVIPANIDTYNGSAFDEFFILELFTNDGVNKPFWQYVTSDSTKTAGVRLYHVDGRLWDAYTNSIIEDLSDFENVLKNDNYYLDLICSNSSTFGDAPGYNLEQYHDYKLITVIQKGGVDTFGKRGRSSRRMLNYSDLFVTGDTFTFEDYDHFLTKSNTPTETTNEGEVFPYTIYFDSVTKSGATVTIRKN